MDTATTNATLALPEAEMECLKTHLTGFWAADKWDMAHCPLLPEGVKIGHIFVEFNHPSASLNTELKYACWYKFNCGRWSPEGSRSGMARVRAILRFLKEHYPNTLSLMEKELNEWLAVFQIYLEQKGQLQGSIFTYLDKLQELRRYQTSDPRFSTLREIYQEVQDGRDNRTAYEKDIWDIRKMGTPISPADEARSLCFTNLHQPWLRQAAKRFLRYRLSICTLSTCLWTLNALNNFSDFLAQLSRQIQPYDIDRSLITEYLSYLSTVQIGARARQNSITQLRLFLETCARENWADFPDKRLILDDDIPRHSKSQPRPIPENVLEQLNRHLDALLAPYKIMAIVIQECGMRISELCSLSFDCLVQDQDGDWFLRYYQWKMKKEHSIPITPQLATVVREQQQAVREKWNDKCSILFPNDKGRRMAKYHFARALNQLAVDQEIRDSTGRIFHFRAHTFRHTVGTRMLRGGVKQHHVQRYLGHESPEMTMVYAEITDQDLKKAYQTYKDLAVDVTGKVVIAEQMEVDSADLQWFKRNIMAQALPHGFCALPIIAEPCPVPNACLTCANFRTNSNFLGVLKAELAVTEKLISTARANDWARQVEMNERVAANLHRIIGSLEVTCNDTQKKC